MMLKLWKKLLIFQIFSLLVLPLLAGAQTVNVDAKTLLARTEVSFSPRSGSFVEGSTFQVPILLNTKGRSINGVEIRVNYDRNKLSIVNPTGGTSIIGIWVEPPKFDNTKGTASYVGVVPGGIITESGLIGTITFQAKTTGLATISISSNSKILLNDGLGTEAQADLGRANYTIIAKAPEGVQVFSETHPIQSDWYNNDSPVFSWIQDSGVTGFSFEFNNQPNTIPDNTVDTTIVTKSFEGTHDGLWYFHIKANKGNIWGTTGHFLVRIDTAPPAEFTPQVDFLTAQVISTERTLISFFTTDNLSGVDHYEVGVIDKSQPLTESPVFVQAESPFQVPLRDGAHLEVIVRAVDHAGNVRDESIDVRSIFTITKFLHKYPIYIIFSIFILLLFILIFHILVGHHIIGHVKQIKQMVSRNNPTEYDIRETIQPPSPLSTPPHTDNPNNYIDRLN